MENAHLFSIGHGSRKAEDFLELLSRKKVPLAIMCSERDPAMCHRSMLIAAVLEGKGIDVMHIDEEGNLKGQGQLDLTNFSGAELAKKKK